MTAACELEPPAAAVLVSDSAALDQLRVFAANLARQGEPLGLIGPLELPRLWTRHLLNSVVLAPLLQAGARVGDVGSGAGLPGLVVAIARPDVSFVLIEPMERRVLWLEQQRNELGLSNVEVIRARAEDAGLIRALDQVTARAVSALRTLVPMTARLVKPGGELVLMKGAGAERELEAAEKAVRKFKLQSIEILELGSGVLTETTRVVRAIVP